MTEQTDKLIYLLQKGLPLVSRPFAEMARQMAMSEAEVIDKIKMLQQTGLVRRFGGVFNSASLGYQACLCAVNVPESGMEKVNSLISPHPGVTHCYIRDGIPNLWFTVTVHKSQYHETLENFKKMLTPLKLLTFPAVKPFKIQVIFDKTGSGKSSLSPALKGITIQLSDREKEVVRYLQGDIPISTELFNDMAGTVGYKEKELLQLLKKWQQLGVLKRISCIIRHRQFGFKANAMCVWNIPEEHIEKAGAKLAEYSYVTHCYQREINTDFPFNLYVMIHAECQHKAREKFRKIETIEHLNNGIIFFSTKELKKTSPVYFKKFTR